MIWDNFDYVRQVAVEASLGVGFALIFSRQDTDLFIFTSEATRPDLFSKFGSLPQLAKACNNLQILLSHGSKISNVRIHAFCNHYSISALELALDGLKNGDTKNCKLQLYLYSTISKDEQLGLKSLENTLPKNFEFFIDFLPKSRSAVSDGKSVKPRFYIVCDHSSCATAALEFLVSSYNDNFSVSVEKPQIIPDFSLFLPYLESKMTIEHLPLDVDGRKELTERWSFLFHLVTLKGNRNLYTCRTIIPEEFMSTHLTLQRSVKLKEIFSEKSDLKFANYEKWLDQFFTSGKGLYPFQDGNQFRAMIPYEFVRVSSAEVNENLLNRSIIKPLISSETSMLICCVEIAVVEDESRWFTSWLKKFGIPRKLDQNSLAYITPSLIAKFPTQLRCFLVPFILERVKEVTWWYNTVYELTKALDICLENVDVDEFQSFLRGHEKLMNCRSVLCDGSPYRLGNPWQLNKIKGCECWPKLEAGFNLDI